MPFVDAELDTGFLEKHHADIFHDSAYGNEQEVANQIPLASLYLILRQQQRASDRASQSTEPDSPWNLANDWRLNDSHMHQFTLCCNDQQVDVSAEQIGNGQQLSHGQQPYFRISCNGISVDAKGSIKGNVLASEINGYRSQVSIAEQGNVYSAYTQQAAFQFNVLNTSFDDDDSSGGDNSLSAPMNGTIVGLLVNAWAKVKQGDALLVMEAMKMEHTIRAPTDGTVDEFYFQAGDLVDGGSELLRMIEEPGDKV